MRARRANCVCPYCHQMHLLWQACSRAHNEMRKLAQGSCGCTETYNESSWYEYMQARVCHSAEAAAEHTRCGSFAAGACVTGDCKECGFDSRRHMCHANDGDMTAASALCSVNVEIHEQVWLQTRVGSPHHPLPIPFEMHGSHIAHAHIRMHIFTLMSTATCSFFFFYPHTYGTHSHALFCLVGRCWRICGLF